jgi:plastocyanin
MVKLTRLVLMSAILLATDTMASEPVHVMQKGLMFTPNELTLSKGQTVEFENDDTTSHNILITSDGVSFNGGLQPPGGHVRYTFTKTGTFVVSCGIHPKMNLTITVN